MIKRKNDVESFDQKDSCPKCHFHRMTAWSDLTEEQKMLAERLPASSEYLPAERKKHRFCERCWFEETERTNSAA